jgi:hypothetical protein
MQTAMSAQWAPPEEAFFTPQIACPPEALLVMGRGIERSCVKGALASGGWSVTSVDDGWTLLDHLAGALLSGGVWKPPALVVLEIAVAGPRLGELFSRMRALFPRLPVLLVGSAREAGPEERLDKSILRAPFGSKQVLAAVSRAMRGSGPA